MAQQVRSHRSRPIVFTPLVSWYEPGHGRHSRRTQRAHRTWHAGHAIAGRPDARACGVRTPRIGGGAHDRTRRLPELRQEAERESRSLPGWNSRPANRARNPRPRDAASRCSICSTICSAVARPNGARSAAGIGSTFSIVPVVSPSCSHAPDAFNSASVNVSSPSVCASSRTPALMVFLDSPAWNVSVPLRRRVVVARVRVAVARRVVDRHLR